MDITHLSKTDLEILELLLKENTPLTINDLCRNLNKEKQTIYNALPSLRSKELIETVGCFNTVAITIPKDKRKRISFLFRL